MAENLFSPFNREQQVSASEYEAEMLVYLNESIEEYDSWIREHTGSVGPDAAPDVLADYCGVIAKRDAAFGRLLVRKLIERANFKVGPDTRPNEMPRDGAIEHHMELALNVNNDLIEAGHVQSGWLHDEWTREGIPFPEIDLEG